RVITLCIPSHHILILSPPPHPHAHEPTLIPYTTFFQSWTKAGVMLRQSSDPGSAYYAAFVTPGNGIVVQYRTAQGGNTQQSASLTGTVPAYLMVARSGNTYTAYTSTNGTSSEARRVGNVARYTNGSVLEGLTVNSQTAS